MNLGLGLNLVAKLPRSGEQRHPARGGRVRLRGGGRGLTRARPVGRKPTAAQHDNGITSPVGLWWRTHPFPRSQTPVCPWVGAHSWGVRCGGCWGVRGMGPVIRGGTTHTVPPAGGSCRRHPPRAERHWCCFCHRRIRQAEGNTETQSLQLAANSPRPNPKWLIPGPLAAAGRQLDYTPDTFPPNRYRPQSTQLGRARRSASTQVRSCNDQGRISVKVSSVQNGALVGNAGQGATRSKCGSCSGLGDWHMRE